jgi:hypothetical protein
MNFSKSNIREGQIREAIQNSFSKAGTIKALGLNVSGGNYKILDNFISKHNIDTSHWTGQGHLKNKKNPWNKSKNKTEDLLVTGSTFQTFKLKQRLLNEGLIQNKCFECGIISWNGKEISLHLDHINGKSNDHRIENLRMLCPNCHSQTDTYCAKNKKIKFEISKEDIESINNKTLSIKDASEKYKVSVGTFKKKLRDS